MLEFIASIVVAVVAVAAGTVAVGRLRWYQLTQARLRSLRAHRAAPAVLPSTHGDLPDPVARYLSLVLPDGQPAIQTAQLEHTGRFRMSDSPTGWRPFRSRQWVRVFPPGMLWNASIRMNPALSTLVHDAYSLGEGVLQASLHGVVTVARRTGGGPLAEAELMRYLAEAVWYPTALLPGAGVEWRVVDASTSLARLETDGLVVELEFRFGEDGLVESVYAERRYRGQKDGEHVFRPWHGRFWSYGEWGGVRIPVEGEVAWDMDGRDVPYWQGRIRSVRYDVGT